MCLCAVAIQNFTIYLLWHTYSCILVRNLSLGRRQLVNAYEVNADIGVIAGNTVWSMPELLECEVLQKERYINTLTSTFKDHVRK